MATKQKQPRVPGTPGRRQKVARGDVQETALHEASHLVVGHALGRRAVYVRITPERLPDGRTSLGLVLVEPDLTEEITTEHAAGVPITAEQRRWVLEEAVITLAGAVAEMVARPETAAADMERAGWCALMLGVVRPHPGTPHMEADPRFIDTAAAIAHTVTRERETGVLAMAKALAAAGEMREPQIAAVLTDAARGSHMHLTVGLNAIAVERAG